jgi:signal transduction histidine kinase/ligand-binding sensor domain-containing protein
MPAPFPSLRPPLPLVLRSLALSLLTAAALGAPAPDDYFYRSWRIDNGLPDNSVNAILQDRHGFLWLATMTGLVRFDGHTFEEIPLPAPLRASGENIRALAREDASTLIMLPASGGIIEFRDGRFSRPPADAAVRGRTLRQLFVAPDGALWLGDNGSGEILRWKGGETTVFGRAEGLGPTIAGFSLATDGTGQIWIAQGGFLGRFHEGRLERFAAAEGSDFVVGAARSGGIWISTTQHLLKWDHGQLETLDQAPDWPAAQSIVQQLFEDRAGVLWVATRRSGLYQYAAGRVRAFRTDQQQVTGMTEDSEQGLWVASGGGGISRLQRQPFVAIDPGNGPTDIASTAVCEDPSGVVWCANRSGGVVRYADGAVQHVYAPAGQPAVYVNSVCVDASGSVWAGASSGLYRVRPSGPPELDLADTSITDIHVLYATREGDLWISSGHGGLARRHHGTVEAITAQQGYPAKYVVAVTETADGTVWIALEHELYLFRDGGMVRQTAIDSYSSQRLNALYGDRQGALWIGTSHGLLRLQGQQLGIFSQANGLPNDRIEQVLEDDRGLLWLGSRRGFFYAPRSELEAVAGGRLPRADMITFGPEQGLKGQVPVSNCQPNTWKGAGNRLWFCTQQGVIGIDAASIPLRLPPPPVYVDRVLVDGRDVGQSHLRLSAGQHRLVFDFTSPSFAAPEKVRLRHRLTGFDSGWIETASDQEANYTGLAAGSYTLDVTASDANGIWREGAAAALSFVVVPAWWQTWWAEALALAAFISGLAWFVRYASHRRLKHRLARMEQEHALEKERARIARDLHDELGGSLTQIGLLADRLKRGAHKAELEPGLSQLARHTRQLTGELESIIWTVNPQNNSLDRFALFVRQFALRFFRDTGIACTVCGVEEIPALRLTPEVQHHLLTATKEALHNVLKHSQGTSVTLGLSFSRGVLAMVIRDNGIGFNPEAAENKERNGLANIASRLREIHGALKIRSAVREGTTVAWEIPLPERTERPDPAPAHL